MTIKTTKAVGYVRVSTDMQNVEGRDLAVQAEKIRKLCVKRSVNLVAVYEDVGSAVDDFSIERRPSLKEALSRAEQEGAWLVVSDPTRLFRNVLIAEKWLGTHSVKILSVKHGRILKKKEFLDEVAKGHDVAQKTIEGTKKALAEQKAAGINRTSGLDRAAANKASAQSRKANSFDVVLRIARVLQENPFHSKLPHQAFADLLNSRGILSGWSKPWTARGVVRQRRMAEDLVEEWRDIDNLPDGDPLPDREAPKQHLEDQRSKDPIDEEQRALENNPYFGMF